MNHYNILVVDDESFIVDWLTELLEKQPSQRYNVYSAYDAKKALEWIERTRIDLLISDIRMPNSSGFDLLEQAQKRWPLCKCILLTAHAEFEYAHEAVKRGVNSFILKTEGDEYILNEVQKVLDIIDTEMNQQKLISDMQKNLSSSLSQLKRYVFFQWLRGNFQNPQELEQCTNILGFSDTNTTFCLLMGVIKAKRNYTDSTAPFADTMKTYQIKSIVEHFLEPYVLSYAAEISNEKIIWIIQPNHTLSAQFTQTITGALELAQQSVLKTTEVPLAFTVSAPSGHPNDITVAYSKGKSLLHSHGNDLIVLTYLVTGEGEHARRKGIESSNILRSASFASLRRYLDNDDKDSYFGLVHSICTELSNLYNWHNSYYLESYYTLVLVLLSHINKQSIGPDEKISNIISKLFKPWQMDSWQDVEQSILTISDIIFTYKDERHKKTSQDIINDVINYIDEHILEDISLVDLSDLTGYSASYLSKFFSDNYTSTIREYIANQKIKKVKEFMKNPELTIGEIATMTGFNSRTYFNSFFKNNVGMPPQQYRQTVLDI